MEAVVPRPAGHALDCFPKSRRSGRTQSLFGGYPSYCTPQPFRPPEGGITLPVAHAPYPESHPFAWFPLAGQRHAIDRRDRNVSVGSPMWCLCDVTHPRGGESKMEWLWPTCEGCWEEACRIVGVRGRE